jgi:hypothetical protein
MGNSERKYLKNKYLKYGIIRRIFILKMGKYRNKFAGKNIKFSSKLS